MLSYRITHYLPGTFSKVLGIQAPASEYRGLWSDVLDALRLTPRQARAMTAHVRSFHDRYLGLLRQRGMLLRETAGAPRSEEGMPLQATAAASLAVAQRLWELECSLATEQRLVGEATGHLFGLLDPIQNSTLFTASAPHLPDVLWCGRRAWGFWELRKGGRRRARMEWSMPVNRRTTRLHDDIPPSPHTKWNKSPASHSPQSVCGVGGKAGDDAAAGGPQHHGHCGGAVRNAQDEARATATCPAFCLLILPAGA